MCGIAGFVSTHPQPAMPISDMTRLVRHRGPDDEGFVLFGNDSDAPIVAGGFDTPEIVWRSQMPYVPSDRIETLSDMPVMMAMGHRRLAILDLSALGHQPMSYRDGRYWIVHNGEIYNFTELRRELESLGHRFLSNTDTEVILAAYDQWGAGCLDRFNGMWAFALFDRQCRTWFLARDRFGVKPLYYWTAPDGTFCFASEIKQFSVFPGWKAVMNPQRVYDFLVWGMTDHTDETLFSGVDQISPGHFMLWNLAEPIDVHFRKSAIQRWYEIRPSRFDGDFDDAAAEFKEKLQDAVRLRLRSDVPVGSCLSGGLDSSSIVCLMHRLLREEGRADRQKTFSACADVPQFDERGWTDDVVRATGVDAHYVYPPLESLFAELPALTWHQDEPFGSTSIFAQRHVFHLASENGVKVMLDGQGADEPLAGYHEFFGYYFADLFCRGRWWELWREAAATSRLHGYSMMQLTAEMASALFPHAIQDPLRKALGKTHTAPPWLNLKTLGAESKYPMVNSGMRQHLLSLSIQQLTASNIPRFLHWEDRNSMACSIESRVPFLDYRLVEFVLGLPDNFKMSGGITKRILREGMRGILPDRVCNRMGKLGFATPESVWVREQAPDLFRAQLQRAVERSRGVLSPQCMYLLDRMIMGAVPFHFRIWRMISFGQWMDIFSVGHGGGLS